MSIVQTFSASLKSTTAMRQKKKNEAPVDLSATQ